MDEFLREVTKDFGNDAPPPPPRGATEGEMIEAFQRMMYGPGMTSFPYEGRSLLPAPFELLRDLAADSYPDLDFELILESDLPRLGCGCRDYLTVATSRPGLTEKDEEMYGPGKIPISMSFTDHHGMESVTVDFSPEDCKKLVNALLSAIAKVEAMTGHDPS